MRPSATLSVADVVRSYALDALGDPDGVPVVDETRFVKKGKPSAGEKHRVSFASGIRWM